MKQVIVISSVIILSLLTVIFLGIIELRKEKQLDQSTIDGLKIKMLMDKKAFEHALDSIRKVQLMQVDSTKYYRLLKTKDQQTVTTKTESHEKIVFTNLDDSTRHSKLAKFYPSYIRP